ncbi:uncharacterized protein A4U43_C01F17270 [Asparagus officinalis]|uniref:Uncharacterized protein n=1 Tax=Asparagus officinalis TaxID=4686 RepID=A0A5P1FUM7_ASPOF|nr:uncharacterized protein A4U43_C01F17270 [Asparagus officinalis]
MQRGRKSTEPWYLKMFLKKTRKLTRNSTRGAMDVTVIVSSEDEEGEKEDIDCPDGSDAVVDDAFQDNDEDVLAFPPTLEVEPLHEPAL